MGNPEMKRIKGKAFLINSKYNFILKQIKLMKLIAKRDTTANGTKAM